MSNGYKSLDVRNKSYELTLNLYDLTRNFPKEEMYHITMQIRKASSSIPANVAEGYSKGYLNEYIRYVGNAIGSCNELEVFIMLSKDLDYIDEDEYIALNSSQDEISKMLFGLRKALINRRNSN
jgi:four helix bundle protein